MKNLTSSITWSTYPAYPRAILSILQVIGTAKSKIGLVSEDTSRAIEEAIQEVIQASFDWKILGVSDLSLTKKILEEVIAKIPEKLQPEARGALTAGYSPYALFLTAKEYVILRELRLLLDSTSNLKKILLQKAQAFSEERTYARDHLRDADEINFSTVFEIFEQGISEQDELISCSLNRWNINYLISYRPGLEEAPTNISGFQSALRQELEKQFELKLDNLPGYLDFLNFGVKLLNSHALLQGLSTQVWRIANDLRIRASGPRGGLSEITLPAVAPGSSIMPGKLNPIIAEMIYGTCDQVDADHAGISMSLKSGWLETAATSSLSLKAYLQSVELLRRSIDCFTNLCISGVEINKKA